MDPAHQKSISPKTDAKLMRYVYKRDQLCLLCFFITNAMVPSAASSARVSRAAGVLSPVGGEREKRQPSGLLTKSK